MRGCGQDQALPTLLAAVPIGCGWLAVDGARRPSREREGGDAAYGTVRAIRKPMYSPFEKDEA
jgi:hypothetical protein